MKALAVFLAIFGISKVVSFISDEITIESDIEYDLDWVRQIVPYFILADGLLELLCGLFIIFMI